MERIVMVKPFHGIASMVVCVEKDATDEEILRFCNHENPSGTSWGWQTVVRKDTEHEGRDPLVCADDPNRLHIIVDC